MSLLLSNLSSRCGNIFIPQPSMSKAKRESLLEAASQLQNFTTKVQSVLAAFQDISSCARRQETSWQQIMEDASPWKAHHHQQPLDDDDDDTIQQQVLQKAKSDVNYLVAKNTSHTVVEQERILEELRRWYDTIHPDIATALQQGRNDWNTVVHYQQKIERLQTQLNKLVEVSSTNENATAAAAAATVAAIESSPRYIAMEEKIRRNEVKLVEAMRVFAQSESILASKTEPLQSKVWLDLQEWIAQFASTVVQGSTAMTNMATIIGTAFSSTTHRAQKEQQESAAAHHRRLPAQISNDSSSGTSSTASPSATAATTAELSSAPSLRTRDKLAGTTTTTTSTIAPCSTPVVPLTTTRADLSQPLPPRRAVSPPGLLLSPSNNNNNNSNSSAEAMSNTATATTNSPPWAQATIVGSPMGTTTPLVRTSMSSTPVDTVKRQQDIATELFPLDLLAPSDQQQPPTRRRPDGASAFPTDILAGYETAGGTTTTTAATTTNPIPTSTSHRNYYYGVHSNAVRPTAGEDVEIDLSNGIGSHVYEDLYRGLERSSSR